jgi:general secretion pathway protein D
VLGGAGGGGLGGGAGGGLGGGLGGGASSSASAGGGGAGLGAGLGAAAGGNAAAGGGGLGAGGAGQNPFGSLGGPSANAEAEAGGGGGGGGAKGSALLPGVRIMADVPNNSVVIYANQQSYHVIEKALEQLDRPKLQVAIDVTIAEVTLNDTLSYGVQFFLGHTLASASSTTGATTTATTVLSTPVNGVINSASTGLPGASLPGFNVMLGNNLTPNVVINALHQYTNVKVLSNPSLVVVDNQVATLTVGDQIPVTTGSANILNSATASSNTVFNSINYENTGIILRVQPRVNFNGNVTLDVDQEISECKNCASNSQNPNLTPTIADRHVKSSIVVADSQTVLLAGLIQDSGNLTKSGIPGLDQIPIIGNAFNNYSSNLVGRTELIIFIRPQVIHDGVDASFVAEELRSKMRGEKVGSVYPTGAVTPVPTRALQQLNQQ